MNRRITAIFAAWAALAAMGSVARADDIAPGLYLRSAYAFGNLSLNTIFIGAGNRIAIDPKGGTDSFDFAAAAKQSPGTVGAFKIEGKKIACTWANGKTDRLDVEFEKGAFSAYDGGLITKA